MPYKDLKSDGGLFQVSNSSDSTLALDHEANTESKKTTLYQRGVGLVTWEFDARSCELFSTQGAANKPDSRDP